MGTRITSQKRGRGSPRYRTPGHRYYGDVSYPVLAKSLGQVLYFEMDPGRHALLAEILLEDGKTTLAVIAAEGLKVGDKVLFRYEQTYTLPEVFEYDRTLVKTGCVLPLSMIADGCFAFNLESQPADGGRLGRSSGSNILVVGHDEETGLVTVKLDSKKLKVLDPRCRATIGIAAGGGRKEKPFKKAGYKRFAMRARDKVWPKASGTSMSAYDHPFGGKSFGKAKTVSHSTSPGRKVGLIAASRTGRRKGKRARATEGQQES